MSICGRKRATVQFITWRRFIFLFSTIQQYSCKTDSIKTQSGGLPERYKAHLSWPPIVTKNNNTKPIYCKVQGAGCKGQKCAQISNVSSYRC